MVTQNDPSLTELLIFDSNNYHGVNDGEFYSDNSDDYSALGAAIAHNTHLASLAVILSNDAVPLSLADRFYDGIKQNSTIRKFSLLCGQNHIMEGMNIGHELLAAYQENSSLLTEFAIAHARLENGGDRVVTTTLRRCINLKTINLAYAGLTDEHN